MKGWLRRTIEDLLQAPLESVTLATEAIGIVVGMTNKMK